MKWFRVEPFMAAYRVALIAALSFFLLLLILPVWALLPALFWLAAMYVMVREYRRLVALEKQWQHRSQGGVHG